MNKLVVIVKDLVALENDILDKIHNSWKSIVISLNYSHQPITMKNLLTSLGVEVEEGLKETQMHFYVYVISPKFESFRNGYKNFFKKGRFLICFVSRKNFKFSNKNKKGKGKCINYEKFGYCQFNCSKKKMITNL